MQTGFPAELMAPLQPLLEQLWGVPQVDYDRVSKEGSSQISSIANVPRLEDTRTPESCRCSAQYWSC
jgi:hypothetical protein